MRLIKTLKILFPSLFKTAHARNALCCSACQAQIHRHDRYIILVARHRDCSDPKLVKQMSLPIPHDTPELLP